jgi:hypothetical protein
VILLKGRRHTPEQIVRKLREADRLLAEGSDVEAVAGPVLRPRELASRAKTASARRSALPMNRLKQANPASGR